MGASDEQVPENEPSADTRIGAPEVGERSASGTGTSTPSRISVGGATRDVRGAVASYHHVGDLRRAKPALIFACFAWPLFACLDVAHVVMTGTGDLAALLAMRALPVPVFVVAALRVTRRPPISERELELLLYGSIYVVMLTVALECLLTGGLHSLFAEANLAILATTTIVPRPWRHHGPRMAFAALLYPLVMLLGVALYPPMQGQLSDGAALYVFGAHLVMLWTTTGIVVLGSHRIWALRREVFEKRSIGRYELRRRIGKGGMGEVWAAWHRGLEREVALKILRLEDDEDELAAARFEREVRLSAGLTHPNTVRVFDYGTTEDGLVYYAMELLAGETLAQLVRREGPLAPARAVYLVSQAASALGEAHGRGIVHRDVKPENLFVTVAGGAHDFVKVLDFGIARIEEEAGAAHLTRTGAVAGTPSTMSPEVITGDRATAASDVYALGAVLYFALTGTPPFSGEVPASTLMAHLHDAVVPPSVRVGRELPPDLERIVLRCLEKKPERRYADGDALAASLARLDTTWEPARVPVAAPASLPPAPLESTPSDADTRVEVRRR